MESRTFIFVEFEIIILKHVFNGESPEQAKELTSRKSKTRQGSKEAHWIQEAVECMLNQSCNSNAADEEAGQKALAYMEISDLV